MIIIAQALYVTVLLVLLLLVIVSLITIYVGVSDESATILIVGVVAFIVTLFLFLLMWIHGFENGFNWPWITGVA